jgi:hypothetical protein
MLLPIQLLSERPNVAPKDLLDLHDGPIVACDCYVIGAEHWQPVVGGYADGRIVNVDHHAPTRAMARRVSSANLALERVRALGLPSADTAIFVTHADCDSVLSAGILSGRLAAEERYGEAALAADHSGEMNPVADLLQSLDRRRDLALSFRALASLEAGEALPIDIQRELDEQHRRRAVAERCVRDGRMTMHGPIAVSRLRESLDGAYFTPLLPDAVVILLAIPHDDDPVRLEMKLRLGHAAPSGFSLHDLKIRDFDPAYGGRWNAGSNRRAGGTALTLDEYARQLRTRVEAALRQATSPV